MRESQRQNRQVELQLFGECMLQFAKELGWEEMEHIH